MKSQLGGLKLENIHFSEPIHALGIDLGTTNSSAAVIDWEPGKEPVCRVLEIDQPTREGLFTSPLVPSIVALNPDMSIWVGEGANLNYS